ncbi:hypothetical protein [Clostridium tagluense]|uniref:hypothetical protein n=1 Tax=Clostridium tagluense TaxID=360422 RepID=UPI001C6F04A9|nr:hypothetical protein [Clostridium tagluense]MBW9159234.1 hypothetical protein [Clostridium tagluense]WLC68132.1 hypothetical protein KTC93_24460 [Clostridium tagluense]
MKYFKYDLWRGINSDSEKILDESLAEWDKNAKAYNEVFESIQNRFSKKTCLIKAGFEITELAHPDPEESLICTVPFLENFSFNVTYCIGSLY